MGSRAWYIVTMKRLYCERCHKWIAISNQTDAGITSTHQMHPNEREWVEHHCSVCGDGDELCNCIEPRGCSGLNWGMFAEDADSIPF